MVHVAEKASPRRTDALLCLFRLDGCSDDLDPVDHSVDVVQELEPLQQARDGVAEFETGGVGGTVFEKATEVLSMVERGKAHPLYRQCPQLVYFADAEFSQSPSMGLEKVRVVCIRRVHQSVFGQGIGVLFDLVKDVSRREFIVESYRAVKLLAHPS